MSKVPAEPLLREIELPDDDSVGVTHGYGTVDVIDSGPVSPFSSDTIFRERINSSEPYISDISPQIEKTKQKTHVSDEQNSSCRQQAITVFGWAFDFVTVAISLIDVVSDILVALQFLHDGHTVWAWLVFGCFINSNCIYSAMITELCFKDEYNEHGYYALMPSCLKKLPRPLLFIMVFPFAQLSPSVNYFLQTFVIDKTKREETLSSYNPKVVGIKIQDDAAEVAKQEQRAVEGSVETMGRLQDALKKQFHTHGMLFTETVVESIPQSIIQLLAITFLGSPSDLQVFSMSLSLLSVVSKGYFASVSCDLRIFFVKFLMISHDVFSMFYLFCSIVSKEGPKDYALFGVVDVSWISLVWFIKVFAVAATGALFLIFFAVLLLLGHCMFDDARLSSEDLRFGVVFGVGCVFGFIPALLALETMKFSWLILVTHQHEPESSNLPLSAMLFSFLQGTTTSDTKSLDVTKSSSNPKAVSKLIEGRNGRRFCVNEWRERVAYFYNAGYQHLLTFGLESNDRYRFGVNQKWYFDRTARLQLMTEGTLRSAMLEARRRRPKTMEDNVQYSWENGGNLPDDGWLDAIEEDQLIMRDPILSLDVANRLSGQWYFNSESVQKAIISHDRMWELDESILKEISKKRKEVEEADLLQSEKNELLHNYTVNTIFSHKRLREHYFAQRPLINTSIGGNETIAWFVKRLYVGFHAVNGTCTLVSLFYPYINYPIHFHTQNLLQHVCFGLMVASLVLMLPLLPTVSKYLRFIFESDLIMRYLMRTKYSYDRNANVVGLKELGSHIATYHLPPMSRALRDVIPNDLLPTDIISVIDELLPGAVDLRHLTIAECRRMKFS